MAHNPVFPHPPALSEPPLPGSESALLERCQLAEAYLRAGDLRHAADTCRAVLNERPDYAYGYYLMSRLFQATGVFPKALEFAALAVSLDASVAVFHLHQGDILCAQEDWELAALAYEHAHQAAPDMAAPLLRLAECQSRLHYFDEALELCRRARALQDDADTAITEGRCLERKGEIRAAAALFEHVTNHYPHCADGHLHKAHLLREARQLSDAEASYARALNIDAELPEALHGLAVLYERQGQTALAMQYALRAAKAAPVQWPSYFLLISLLMTQQDYASAENILRQIVPLKPNNAYILQLLSTALMRQRKHFDPSLLEQCGEADRHHPVVKHFYALWKGQVIDNPPKEYIAGVFDGYAEQFDHHRQSNAYAAPHLIKKHVRGLHKAGQRLSLLDMGCGTGLIAEALRDYTGLRIGVDISAHMLAKARMKLLYDETHHLEAAEFMTGCDRVFDLVTAADTLSYMGNLTPFLRSARNVLPASGHILFTVETDTMSLDYRLGSDGRYRHTQQYIERLAAEEGYVMVGREAFILCLREGAPVPGLLFVCKKSLMH